MGGANTRIQGIIKPRITRSASWQQDEGIVQPFSKDKDKLSRRLHHIDTPAPAGVLFWSLHITTYKQNNVLTAPEAAYIAGLIDGEGTVTLTRKHKNENRQLCISISSTEINLLDFVLTTSGVVKITNKQVRKSHHTHSYTYAVYNRQALTLLEQTLPFLKSYKHYRAALILNNYLSVTPRNGKYNDEILARKSKFERAVLAIKANS